MSKRLDETIGAVGFDNLINGQYPPAEVFTVKIRKEATEAKTYKRGTVLALSAGTAGDGLRVILGTAAKSDETLTANCVLADDVEVGTASDAVATAYRTGHFNENSLITDNSHAISETDKEALRSAGILLSDAVAY